MVWLFIIVLNLFAAQSAHAAEARLSLPQLLERAHEQNPDVRAAHQAWKVSQALVSPAAAWPDSTFTYIDEKFPPGMSGGEAEKIRHYRIEQPIPFPGKLTNESKMKFHEALISESRYRARLLDTMRDLKMRYYQLYLTDEKIALAQESVNVLKNALQTAQSRLGAGKSSALDVFMVGTELHKMENALYEQRQQRTLISIEINTLLNQPTETPLGRAEKPVLVLRGENSRVWTRESFESERDHFRQAEIRHGKKLPISFVEMKDCGHGLPFEKRAEFCQRLVDWAEADVWSQASRSP
jgi:outer membrane protein TolC